MAAATNSAIMVNGKPKYESKYYYTQDGIRWVDLETEVSPEDVERCRKLVSPLSGNRCPGAVFRMAAGICRHPEASRWTGG